MDMHVQAADLVLAVLAGKGLTHLSVLSIRVRVEPLSLDCLLRSYNPKILLVS